MKQLESGTDFDHTIVRMYDDQAPEDARYAVEVYDVRMQEMIQRTEQVTLVEALKDRYGWMFHRENGFSSAQLAKCERELIEAIKDGL